jgi:hypothetical protein
VGWAYGQVEETNTFRICVGNILEKGHQKGDDKLMYKYILVIQIVMKQVDQTDSGSYPMANVNYGAIIQHITQISI